MHSDDTRTDDAESMVLVRVLQNHIALMQNLLETAHAHSIRCGLSVVHVAGGGGVHMMDCEA